MKKNLIKILFIIPIISFINLSCDDANQINRFNFVFPEDEEISYRFHVEPFLRLRCAYSGCHSSNSIAGGIDLSSWFKLWSGPGIINLQDDNQGGYNPDASLLLQVMDQRNPHLLNLNLIPATENQEVGIRRWLENGAENN
ncbi:hypothetical protein OAQ99_04335 [Candidatus Kapabacteria bacterium]|nr:hypothetical protein [Candidatus Kapabacteria bacterium]